ncbi:hypothetical protein [Acetobacter indonesiensis]
MVFLPVFIQTRFSLNVVRLRIKTGCDAPPIRDFADRIATTFHTPPCS